MTPDTSGNNRQSVSFYSISLQCEAASKIGCGIRAKPLLRALEESKRVRGAWLSRSGTTLAVEWSSRDGVDDLELIRTAMGDDQVSLTRLNDAQCETYQKELSAGQWYRADDLDGLSGEESWIIAHRLVGRMLLVAAIKPARQEIIRRTVAKACVSVLKTAAPGTAEVRERVLGDAILAGARCELDKTEVALLRLAVEAGGHRPAPGEE